MDAVWYYAVNGAQSGPVTFAELKAAVARGAVSANDLVWKEGMADWVPARTVPDLVPPPAPRPAPPVPPHPTAAPAYGLEPPPPRPAAALPLDPDPLPLDDAPTRKPRRKYRDDDGAPAKAAGGSEFVALAQLFARRAFTPDPGTVTPTADEEADLTRNRVTDPVARRLAVWRRGVLFTAAVPCAFAALFGLISTIANGTDGMSAFGTLVLYAQALALFALPAFAVLAALNYDKLATSVWFVRLGALISLGVPLAVAFVPGEWLIDLDLGRDASALAVANAKMGIGIALGIAFYIVLMPAVLSLLPGVSRACVRLKLLLPESLVPGWGLMASAPLCVLLTLATFVLLYHLVGNALLIAGLLLWVGAPLYYLTKPHLLTKPVTSAEDRAALGNASFTVLLLTASGMLLLVVFLFTAKFGGRTLLGFDSEKCVLRPWSLDLHKVWIEYVGRSLFLTVFFADVVLRVALSVWKESKAFAGTEPAAAHDATMDGLSASVGAK
jgi:hypothetical protein